MILVTGATGHIGNVLVRKLISKGLNVKVMVLPGDNLKSLNDLNIDVVEGDVTDYNSIISALDGVTTVFHLAGIISIMPGLDELLYNVNVRGTRNMVNASLEKNVKRFIYTSSVHALNEPPHGTVIDETCYYKPQSSRGDYDRTKAQASLEVIEGVKKGLNAVIICPSGVIGPYDYNVSQMGQLILNYMNQDMNVYIDGAYDFVDVRDVAQGLILASEKGVSGETYIISGEKITIKELMNLLEENTGIKSPKIKIPHFIARAAGKIAPIYYRNRKTRPLFTNYSAEVLRSNCDITNEKARKELGYTPRPLKVTIRDSVGWFRENPVTIG